MFQWQRRLNSHLPKQWPLAVYSYIYETFHNTDGLSMSKFEGFAVTDIKHSTGLPQLTIIHSNSSGVH